MNKEQQLRELVRKQIDKLTQDEKQAEADYIVDKILTAIDAATNKKADYQYSSAAASPEVKKLAKDLKNNKNAKKELDEELLAERVFDWLLGGARNWAHQILQRRKGYLEKALKYDPKLQRMAKDFGISKSDFEGKVYDLMKRDRRFLEDLASGKVRAKSAYRF